MTIRAAIAGHPIHPMLVPMPIGLWIFSLVSDFVFKSTADARWDAAAYFTLGGGIVGALVAALPGLVDLTGLREPAERRIGTIHLAINLAIVAIQAVNFWLRAQHGPGNLPVLISVAAVAALIVSGWLGGHLVHVLGVTQPRSGSDR